MLRLDLQKAFKGNAQENMWGGCCPAPFQARCSALTNQSSDRGGETKPTAQIRICACAAFLSLTVWEGQRWLRPWPAWKWIVILGISTFFPYFLLQYGKLHSLFFDSPKSTHLDHRVGWQVISSTGCALAPVRTHMRVHLRTFKLPSFTSCLFITD